MPTATYIQEGDALNYTPGSDVSAGDVVVQNELVGVAKRDIPANTQGSISVAGVFDFPKATGASTAIAEGLDVYWDAGALEATTDSATGTNKFIGRSIAAASDSDATVRIRMNQ
jgi:predicted RecA/RadA family phage recombinase